MNFVTNGLRDLRRNRLRSFLPMTMVLLLVSLPLYIAGCGDQVELPSLEQLSEFQHAGPVPLTVDRDRLVKAKIGGGPYRVVSGDVLELTMPAILRVVTADAATTETNTPYACRVDDTGLITLPIVGQITVAKKTLSQIERDVINAYHPKYASTRPAVFARILEYRTQKVSISGAVEKPGIFELRTDQMSLVRLLMEAGGIIEQGALSVKIIHSGSPVSSQRAPANRISTVGSWQSDAQLDNPSDVYKIRAGDVSLTFTQGTVSSTFGQVEVFDSQGVVLLTETLDIGRPVGRLYLLRKLAVRRPWTSTAEIEDKLCALAGSLSSGDRITRNSPHSDLTTTPLLLSSQSDTKDQTSHDHSGKSSIENDPLYKDMEETRQQLAEMLKIEEDPVAQQEPDPLILPIEGLNIPFSDVVLQDGDSVIVERLEQPLFTVLGLVNRPGNFPYPPDVRYNLMQAIGFAGGLDKSAEPRYATVYRLTPEDEITSAVFQVVKVEDGSKLVDALNATVKPGDIVFVEHTPRTRTKVFLETVFRINLGTYLRLEDAWD